MNARKGKRLFYSFLQIHYIYFEHNKKGKKVSFYLCLQFKLFFMKLKKIKIYIASKEKLKKKTEITINSPNN